jgi:hypothetical protein
MFFMHSAGDEFMANHSESKAFALYQEGESQSLYL